LKENTNILLFTLVATFIGDSPSISFITLSLTISLSQLKEKWTMR